MGITCVGISLILIFLRAQLPTFWGVFMANVFLMSGGTLGLLAPARFFQVRVRRAVLALGVGLSGLVLHTLAG